MHNHSVIISVPRVFERHYVAIIEHLILRVLFHVNCILAVGFPADQKWRLHHIILIVFVLLSSLSPADSPYCVDLHV